MDHKTRPIVRNRAVCGGAPIVEGTRIRVSDIVIQYEHHKLSPKEIASEFPSVSVADVLVALAYYNKHRDTIWKEIENDERVFAQAKAAQHVQHPV